MAHPASKFASNSREAALAPVLTDVLPELHLEGHVLTAGDEAGWADRALRDQGLEVTAWRRYAHLSQTAAPWPPNRFFDAATLRIPRSREAFAMTLHAVAGRVRPGGRLLIYGANDEGIKSVDRRLLERFGNARKLAARRHGRLLEASMPDLVPTTLRTHLEDWREQASATLPDGTSIEWVTYPGIFAHGRLDEGSARLLTHIKPPVAGARILDFGCGTGLIAMSLLRGCAAYHADLLDADALAVHAARQNVPAGRVILGNGWLALPSKARPYDLIVSNPPLHKGKHKDFGILRHLIDGARERLSRRGTLIFVVQSTAPVARLAREAGATPHILHDDPRYRVWQLQYA